MGVERKDYLMYGVDVGCDAFDWDKHEAEVEGREDASFDLVYDGMSGNYCVAGKVIAATDQYEGFDGRKIIDPDNLGIDASALAGKISEAFGKEVAPGDIKLMLFSHFH